MSKDWVVGENRYAYAYVYSESGESVTVSSATYTIYKCSDESVVASGVASQQNQYLYCLWQPSTYGTYVIDFDYVVGVETFTSRQIIEVRETLQ